VGAEPQRPARRFGAGSSGGATDAVNLVAGSIRPGHHVAIDINGQTREIRVVDDPVDRLFDRALDTAEDEFRDARGVPDGEAELVLTAPCAATPNAGG
jgi:hypothetical protein